MLNLILKMNQMKSFWIKGSEVLVVGTASLTKRIWTVDQ